MATAENKILHPILVRLTHWINALAILIMVTSGWQIHNASPIFPIYFNHAITLGGWLGGALLWHFAAMWVLVINGLLYVSYGLISGRFRQRLLPFRIQDLFADIGATLRGQLSHDDLGHYNAIQKLFYGGILVVLVVVVVSGLAVWKPVQLSWLTDLMGGFQGARTVHFIAMALIVAFVAIHMVMALLVPKTIRAMVVGK